MNTAFAALERELDACRQRGHAPKVFLRDDDVDQEEASLARLLALGERYGVPLCLGVIPGNLTVNGARWLRKLSLQADGLIELNPHGWRHQNHESAGKKSEFGAARSFAQQRNDLAAAQTRMNELFGAEWFPAFVPPWNRCTETTAQALAELGFPVLSRMVGKAPFAMSGLREIPVTLDWQRWHNGYANHANTIRSAPPAISTFIAALIEELHQPAPIGLMLHHKIMDETAWMNLDALLQMLGTARFHTFRSLLDAFAGTSGQGQSVLPLAKGNEG